MKNIEFYYDELIEMITYNDCMNFAHNHGLDYKEDGLDYKDLITWLNEEYVILDKKEKEYLSTVIKPFRKRVVFIQKRESESNDGEYIHMLLKSYDGHLYDCLDLPAFKKGTMYSGMKLVSDYTPKELGL